MDVVVLVLVDELTNVGSRSLSLGGGLGVLEGVSLLV
jgi:hypothetical protein